jgi:hypothetical protein
MQIHVARGGQALGIFSEEEVRNGLASGQFQGSDHGWTEGQSGWTPLSTFPGLAAAAATSVAPPVFPSSPARYAAPGPQAGVIPLSGQPITTSGVAVASLVCGILGLTILPLLASLPAVICGHVARSQIKQAAGRLRGEGLALAGLITGYASVVLLPVIISIIAILAGIALPIFGAVKAKGEQTKALSNAKQIAIGCRLYAVDHHGAFPKTLDELVPDYMPDRQIFVCTFDKGHDPMGFEYYGGKDTDPPENVLLVSKALSQGKWRVVVYVDSSGRVVRDMPELPPHSP